MKIRSLAVPFVALGLAGIAAPAFAATNSSGLASSVKSAVAKATTVTTVAAKPAVAAKPVVAVKPAVAAPVKATTKSSTKIVNVNTGTKTALIALPGVGPTMAKTIIAGRPYKSMAQFEKVLTPKWSPTAIKAVEAHIAL